MASVNYFYSKNKDDKFFPFFPFPSQHELNGGISSPFISQKDKEEANGLQSNMAQFYCDYCDPYLTLDSSPVRKTHCSGRKHKENVQDCYQKWMQKQAPSLIHKTTAAFQQGKIPPTPFSVLPPAGATIPPPPSLPGPPCPGKLPAHPTGTLP